MEILDLLEICGRGILWFIMFLVDVAIAIGRGFAWLGRKIAQAWEWAWERARERKNEID